VSIAVGATDIVGALKAAFTVTVTELEVTTAVAPSVT